MKKLNKAVEEQDAISEANVVGSAGNLIPSIPAQQVMAGLVITLVTLVNISNTSGQEITADINVKLQPVLEHIDVVTDINVVGNSLFVCTQPGQLYRKNLFANSAPEIFLDLRSEVGRLGSHIPGLPGLGYPEAETYDERGLLGFAADPKFDR